ncbi:hypothetical protein [Demequina lutea]|uniref:Bacteriocin biosynthesis cyclodehydratase domain-containing protein n=1 Tax=Demequina lutea TaxID=431489 RepID=A0A7Z0CJG8_9MICO|nr:hypothetical protein [Demequina lutea]NYI40757.1 hypothetical protein [Demequina lutea]
MRLRNGSRVLDRGDGTVQVGLRSPVVFSGLSAEQRRFVERLETANSVTNRASAPFEEIVSRLEDAGLLANRPTERRTVALNDAGPLGLNVGIALARAGWAVHFEDDAPASASPPHTYAPGTLATTRQSAAADTVARLVPGAAVRVSAARADAWVLISHGAPALDAALAFMSTDTPHLFVVTDERGAMVGPFAVPGEGACGLCDGLARAAVDPAWPRLALQLRAPSVAPPTADADVAASIAGLVCGALGAWRAGDARAWLDSVWSLTTGAPPAFRTVTPDTDCGCGAAAPVGDELAAHRARFK